ncbi:hypothetical protein QTA58_02445 [Neorhizobium sp. CSC1952]|uniref:hypothetical protein n=1 Tax=Neorhizobium sp. CSC1952 TaxID=2978974 RepID=UPI0025A4E718|nr:hypothetical protein [Rhizobium sp. CSC1952]WJR67644.1 hypothetical protein QTA58_02445 [Rhizobium sp. CSC1952]
MSRVRARVAPVLLGAVLLLFFGLLLRSSLDPACSSIRADHDRRMSQSEALLARLSSLSIRDRCDFYRERAALFADKVRPGQACISPGRGPDANRVRTEARLYGDLAQGCSL